MPKRSKSDGSKQPNNSAPSPNSEDIAGSFPHASAAPHRSGWFANQIGTQSYIFLTICVVAQLATILITWPTWELRQFPVNLPWISGTPQISCGVLLIASLGLVLVAPRKFGMPIHLAVLLAAILMDQFRCQPQVLSITVMMIACVWQPVRQLCVWYLITLWLWTGAHKALSPDWFGFVSVDLLKRANLVHPYKYAFAFAAVIAVSEILHGLLAILKPRFAAFTCVALHVGIAVFLIRIDWNYSVLPWNFCMAIVGCWLLLTASVNPSKLALPKPAWQLAMLAVIFVVPAGFYFGLVRNCFAHVLYSENLPIAAITRDDDKLELLYGWDEFHFPFPADQAAFLAYFRASGEPGQKLHILEPRKLLSSGYFALTQNGEVTEISQSEFYSSNQNSHVGIGCDNADYILKLELANVRMLKRKPKEMIYAVEFAPDKFDSSLLDLLPGLPNIEQVQLQGCNVENEDLVKLLNLPKLTAIGLDQTPITADGLKLLRELKQLELIQFNGATYGSVDAIVGSDK